MAGITAADLFARHHHDVYRYLIRMSGRRDVADDLLQDVFLHVVPALRNGHPIGHDRGWIFSIARSMLVDRQRHRQRQVTVVEDATEPSMQASRAVEQSVRSARRALFLPGPRVPVSLAASLAVAAIAASFWFGTTLRMPNASLTVSAPTRMQTLTAPAMMRPEPVVPAGGPAGLGASDVGPAVRPCVSQIAEQPPNPVRVLRFVPGVDWISAPE